MKQMYEFDFTNELYGIIKIIVGEDKVFITGIDEIVEDIRLDYHNKWKG